MIIKVILYKIILMSLVNLLLNNNFFQMTDKEIKKIDQGKLWQSIIKANKHRKIKMSITEHLNDCRGKKVRIVVMNSNALQWKVFPDPYVAPSVLFWSHGCWHIDLLIKWWAFCINSSSVSFIYWRGQFILIQIFDITKFS
jgi:hypothetical protein